MKDINDDLLQFLLNRLHEGYSEYKRNHPDFAHVVEEQLEGKTDAEFEAQFTEKNTTCPHCGEWNARDEIINGCCHECGKWFY
jgi:hypothetical protein